MKGTQIKVLIEGFVRVKVWINVVHDKWQRLVIQHVQYVSKTTGEEYVVERNEVDLVYY